MNDGTFSRQISSIIDNGKPVEIVSKDGLSEVFVKKGDAIRFVTQRCLDIDKIQEYQQPGDAGTITIKNIQPNPQIEMPIMYCQLCGSMLAMDDNSFCSNVDCEQY